MKRLLAAAIAAAALAGAAAARAAARRPPLLPPIPAEAFGALPFMINPEISPDGKRVVASG